jgi:DNA-binding Lrp family transcriptional regulator
MSTVRVAFRAGNAFILDLLKAHRGGRDFTDALILAALVQSGAATLTGQPELQRRYATFAEPPPEALRRAISVNAVAASLGLPFETVRRRMKNLVAAGICEATGQGVRLHQSSLACAEHRLALDAAYVATRGLYRRLTWAGCAPLMDLPPLAQPLPGPEPPSRIAWRASADYLLRMMEHLLPRFENLVRAFVVLEVVRANVAGLPDAVRGEDSAEVSAFVPDGYRRPVRASEIAASLGLPAETTRRNLAEAVEEGRCRRVGPGFIVPAEVLAREAVLSAAAANFRNLSRMFAELAEAGVLARWEAEGLGAGPAVA